MFKNQLVTNVPTFLSVCLSVNERKPRFCLRKGSRLQSLGDIPVVTIIRRNKLLPVIILPYEFMA